jgi:hypothetical protein
MAIYKENRERILRGDFDALENEAQRLRQSKESFFHGSWALTSFYLGVANIEYSTPDAQCIEFINKIKAWMAAKPDSVTARVALAHALTDYAWKARGTGWADTVTESGAKAMEDRLAQAQEVLQEAKKLPQKCPGWWDTAQRVALGQGMDKATYMALVDEATAFEPTYMDFYSNAVLFLQPRWYGESGEAEQFMEKEADKRKGDEADVFYARCVWLLNLRRLDPNLFDAHPQLSWPRTAKGFETLLKRYPDSLSVLSEFARLSVRAHDKARAKPLFMQVGPKMDSRVWFDEADTFEKARQWALAE